MFADSTSAGKRVATAAFIAIAIVPKTAGQVGFQVHKRRWVVERFFACIARSCRFSRDVEKRVASAAAFLYAASVVADRI